ARAPSELFEAQIIFCDRQGMHARNCAPASARSHAQRCIKRQSQLFGWTYNRADITPPARRNRSSPTTLPPTRCGASWLHVLRLCVAQINRYSTDCRQRRLFAAARFTCPFVPVGVCSPFVNTCPRVVVVIGRCLIGTETFARTSLLVRVGFSRAECLFD